QGREGLEEAGEKRGEGGCHLYGFAADRVGESQAPGKKADAAIRQWLPGPVAQIAEQGTADCGELGANLMLASGFEFDLEQGKAIVAGDAPVMEDGFLAIRAWYRMRAIPVECMTQGALFRVGLT